MGTTFAATYFQTVTLSSPAEQPSSVTGTITVTSGVALYGSAGTAWSITNSGLIRSQGTGASGGYGIYLLTGGDITNQSGGTVSGYAGGVLIKGAAGTVVNGGQVIATGTSGFGVDLLSSGAITNLAGATISGNKYGIKLGVFAATVTNDGSIEGGTDAGPFRPGYANRLIVGPGASFSGTVDGGNTIGATPVSTLELASGASTGTLSGLGSQFTNFSSIAVDANASWTLVSDALGAGYTITDTGTLTNTGSLGSAVTLGANAYLSNASGATIAGGSGQYGVYGTGAGPATVVNAGSISGAPANGYGYSGIRLAGGGALTNLATGVINGASGVKVDGTGTLVNAGTIVGTAVSGNGVYLYGGVVTNQNGGTINGGDAGILLWTGGGAVTNQSGGTISGGSDGVFIGGAANLTNQSGGAISGGGFGVYVSFAPATVTNAGMISGGTHAVRFQAGYVNLLVVDPGASFTGTVDGGNTIGATSVSTLELASGASTGTLSGLGTQFIDFAQITVDSGAKWTLSGSNTIAADETLTLNGATLGVSGTLEMQGTLAGDQTVAFAGAGAYLHFDNPSGVAGSVINFADGETIDLKGIDPTTVSYSAGQLHFGSGEAFTLSLANTGTVQATTSTDGAAISLCFCVNTLILTPSGERPVQDLALGDPVTTYRGEARRIAWIGTGKVLATRGRRNAATPVIVRRGALADNVPSRDLRVTKGHSLYLDDALIPVEYLVNHRSIEWDDRAQEVELYHIELETHERPDREWRAGGELS